MRVLTINCGSSTLKFQLMEVCLTASAQERRLARGIVDRIGGRGEIELSPDNDERTVQPAEVPDHGEAALRAIRALDSSGLVGEVEAVGHRVVHGGTRFSEPTLLDNAAVVAIEELTELAPLHNGPALAAIRATREALGPGVPMVATFDTAFHRTMPEKAALYAIPPELAAKHGIRRYGFHGLAHRYMAERYAEIATTPLKQTKLVTLQLGNGCSAAAVDGGRSVDTSMGLTPLEGLVMGTRSGDVDPSLAGFLADREGVSVEEIEGWLNHRSGLRGVSGVSRDMREVLEAKGRGDERALLAVEMFVYRVKKQVGAYLAALDGADAVIFGGGIGEHAPEVRSRILAGMEWCGLELDEETNEGAMGTEARISAEGSRIHAHVVPVDEEKIIARDTIRCLREPDEHHIEEESQAGKRTR
jgi:acetate kinase